MSKVRRAPGQAVEVRGLDDSVSVRAETVETELVHENDEDVGPPTVRRRYCQFGRHQSRAGLQKFSSIHTIYNTPGRSDFTLESLRLYGKALGRVARLVTSRRRPHP